MAGSAPRAARANALPAATPPGAATWKSIPAIRRERRKASSDATHSLPHKRREPSCTTAHTTRRRSTALASRPHGFRSARAPARPRTQTPRVDAAPPSPAAQHGTGGQTVTGTAAPTHARRGAADTSVRPRTPCAGGTARAQCGHSHPGPGTWAHAGSLLPLKVLSFRSPALSLGRVGQTQGRRQSRRT